MNRQPLNVELLTLDDGTQKIAWDVKQLQSLLGISDLLHQEESSSAATTGVNSSGIPTIETVIAILDELGLKDLYEVRYRKQYATIIPKTDSKRPKVAIYVVQQHSELTLSIHERIWMGHQIELLLDSRIGNIGKRTRKLYVPPLGKAEFTPRLIDAMGENVAHLLNFETRLDICIALSILCKLPFCRDLNYWKAVRNKDQSYDLPKINRDSYINYDPLINDMVEQNICFLLTLDQRFPSTSRISLSQNSELKSLLQDLVDNIEIFLRSNGEKPEIHINDEQSDYSKSYDDF